MRTWAISASLALGISIVCVNAVVLLDRGDSIELIARGAPLGVSEVVERAVSLQPIGTDAGETCATPPVPTGIDYVGELRRLLDALRGSIVWVEDYSVPEDFDRGVQDAREVDRLLDMIRIRNTKPPGPFRCSPQLILFLCPAERPDEVIGYLEFKPGGKLTLRTRDHRPGAAGWIDGERSVGMRLTSESCNNVVAWLRSHLLHSAASIIDGLGPQQAAYARRVWEQKSQQQGAVATDAE